MPCIKISRGLHWQMLKAAGHGRIENFLIQWVLSSSAMVNGYEYTKKLFEEYNRVVMPSLTHLSNQQIESIFDYIKEVQ